MKFRCDTVAMSQVFDSTREGTKNTGSHLRIYDRTSAQIWPPLPSPNETTSMWQQASFSSPDSHCRKHDIRGLLLCPERERYASNLLYFISRGECATFARLGQWHGWTQWRLHLSKGRRIPQPVFGLQEITESTWFSRLRRANPSSESTATVLPQLPGLRLRSRC